MLTLLVAAAIADDGNAPGPHAAHARQFAAAPLPPGGQSTLPPGAPPDATVYGYHAYWTGSPLDLDFSRLTHVAVFNVDLNSDGTLSDTDRWTGVAGDLVPLAHSHGVKVHLCMTSFYDSTTNTVLSSASRRTAAITALAALVDEHGADGVNVDIEGLDGDQRDNMTAFIAELAEAVPEVYIATPAIDWTGAFDYSALADLSDGLFIMGYGYHWSGGDPGPVAPLYGGSPWSDYSLEWTVEDYLSSGAPADKIVLGLPLYGRQWPTDGPDVPGTATASGDAFVMHSALDEAAERGSLYDTTTHTPYILETDSQLWFDDVESVRDRIRFAVDSGLQGTGFWALQYEGDPEAFWNMVSEETVFTDIGDGGGGDNEAPVALAGLPILAYPGDTVILDGSPSYDPDGEVTSHAWVQQSGPETTLEKADTDRPRLSVPEPGVYVIALTVTDDAQATGTDTVAVIVSDPSGGLGGCSALAPAWSVVWLGGLLGIGARRRRDG
ncbi:MAG: spore germination protein [Myxococcota bacterium]|jgi:spore germination protein